jgi:predicted RND superfamily exporter protein
VRVLALFVSRHPFGMLVTALLVTALAVAGIVDVRTGQLRLQIDPDVRRLLPDATTKTQFYDRARRLFGDDDVVVLALHTEDIFTPDSLRRIRRLTERIDSLEGVRQVISVANAVDIRSGPDELVVGSFFDEVPEDREGLEQIRQRVLANPMYGPTLVSPDGKSAAVVISFRTMSDIEYLDSGLDDTIRSIAQEERGDAELSVSGGPHLKVEISRTLVRDFIRIIPPILLLLALIPFLAFRSVIGVLVPLLTVVVSLVWTVGVLGWIEQPLNIVTSIVPPLILTVGFAYAIHVVSAYYDEIKEEPPGSIAERREVVRKGLDEVSVPVIVTGMTTAAGFLALTLSPLGAVREFGLLSVLGVLCTMVVSLTLAPSLLVLAPSRSSRRAPLGKGPLEALADRLSQVVLAYRGAVLAGGVLLLGVAIYGTTQIEANTSYFETFPPDSRVRVDFERVNERFGGVNPFSIVLDSDIPDAFMEPTNLGAVRDLQDWLEAQSEIGDTTSVADYLMLLNSALHDDDPDFFTIPETRRLAKQLFFFGSSRGMDALIDSRYQTVNLAVRSRVHDSAGTRDLVERIEARLAELPSHLRANITGNVILLGQAVDELARGQATSMAAAVLTIYAMLALMFSSFRVGLAALFPNILPIAVYFGLLGLSGINLNSTTSLVGTIALGIAVDDTIHYFARFNADARRSGDEKLATRSALRTVIQPVSYTTLALCAGFFILGSSEFKHTAQFGMLAAFTIGAAWLIDVTVTPAVCSGLRIVTLWDTLTLDLGHDPHRSIPFFEGLTLRQARIVALISNMLEVPAGTQLLRQGDEGDEMFVVIEGSLVPSIQRDGSRVDLPNMVRGEVVGEVAPFLHGRRTVDVRADTEVRALVIRWEDLQRLRRRYPRIAAQVFLNLNRIQAARLVRTTEKIR